MHAAAYRFDRFCVLPDERQVLVDGAPAKLGARAFDLLVALIEQRDRTVPRAELFERVWPGRIVEDQNLQVQVVALRKLLGPQAIATVPGRGYRFTAPLVEADAAIAPLPAAPAAPLPEAAPRAASNLPLPGPALVGRVADIAAVCRLLDAHRLVCITGSGGIGKTQLALAVAQQLRASVPDGVWLVELDALTAADRLAGQVARALGLSAEAGRDVTSLARALRPLDALIVLDNCEHLVEGVAALLTALLRQAPRLRVLATSQARLRLAEEQVHALGPLWAPAAGDDEAIDRSPAVALFLARVRSALPAFRLEARQREAAAQICRALDGVPLALELAAARVPLLGVEGVRDRLDERLSLLRRGARDAVPRHRTLRAALEWSHGLLAEPEQQVFRRLAVFAGSFDIEAAQAVAAGAGLDRWAVLDALDVLVDRSLLTMLDHPGARRGRLLDSARSFALERLDAAGEGAALRRRHLSWMLERVREIDERSLSEPSLPLAEALLPDLDNLRAAMRFATGPDGDAGSAAELAGCAAVFCMNAGLRNDGRSWCDAARPLLHDGLAALQRGRFWAGVATLGAGGAAYGQRETLEAAMRAIELLREGGDARRLYYMLYLASLMARRLATGDADVLVGQMAALEQPDWSPLMRRYRRWALMGLARQRGEHDELRRMWQAEIAIARAQGDRRQGWMAAFSLALLERDCGRLDEAIELMRAAVQDIRAAGRLRSHARLAGFLATVLIERGDLARAQAALRDAVPLLQADGLLWWMADALAWVPALEGRWEDAARLQGWADAAVQRHAEGRRSPDWQDDYERLAARLGEELDAPTLQRLRQAGAQLDDESAALLLQLPPHEA